MKLFLIITLVAVVSASRGPMSRSFASLVSSLASDYEDDMDEILSSEEVYLDALGRNEEIYYSGVELLIGEEVELEDEPINGDDGEEEESDSGEPDVSHLPEAVDNREKGIMHKAIHQGMCGSCGWVSGTQTLEARIAYISENWIPYSIQNFMNCAGKPCLGVQPYSVNTQARKSGFIVSEDQVLYTKRECVKQDEGKKACYANCGRKNPANFVNALDDQFVIIAGTRSAQSPAKAMEALQEGPLTTCFSKKSKEEGERCSNGCSHANSIIGYNKDKWLIQESYGKSWGKYNDGSWETTKGSLCGDSIIKKAYYPKIVYDYDRANAYFTSIEGGVNELELTVVEKEQYGITVNNTKNWGTAKNKCAFIGSACKGVTALSSGIFELISDFGAGSTGEQPAFKKVQMVVYLRHEQSGKYIGIKKNRKGKLHVIAVEKKNAAPFFTSYARFISFDYPKYHLVDNVLEPIVGGTKEIDVTKSWTLNSCNIYNDVSGNSFDQIPAKKGNDVFLGANKYDPEAPSQRFNVGLSGSWELRSSDLKLPLASRKNNRIFTLDSKATLLRFRWNARQVITTQATPYGPDMNLTGGEFKFEDKENAMRPRDCAVAKLIPMGYEDNLALENGKVVMSSNTDSRWTFEYADL